jgi:hypothetical protein
MRPDPNDPSADFQVRWYFVPNDREAIGVPTVFGSSVWDEYAFLDQPGEQRDTRVWNRGGPPLFQPLESPPPLCGAEELWKVGWTTDTPGLPLDPNTGAPACCGAGVQVGAVGHAWGAAVGEVAGPCATVEACASTQSFRLDCVCSEAWGAASTNGELLPCAVAQVKACISRSKSPPRGVAHVEGASAAVATPAGYRVAHVQAASSAGGWGLAYPVAQVKACRSIASIAAPRSVAYVEGSSSIASIAAPRSVAHVEGSSSKTTIASPRSVAQVKGARSVWNVQGSQRVGTVAGVHDGRSSKQFAARAATAKGAGGAVSSVHP